MPQSFKNLLAIVFLVASLGIGIPMVLQGDSNVDFNLGDTASAEKMAVIYEIPSTKIQEMSNIRHMVDDGLKPYFLGMGLIFLLVSIAFILMDGEEKLVSLKSGEQEKG